MMSAEDLLSRILCTFYNYMLAAVYLPPIKVSQRTFQDFRHAPLQMPHKLWSHQPIILNEIKLK